MARAPLRLSHIIVYRCQRRIQRPPRNHMMGADRRQELHCKPAQGKTEPVAPRDGPIAGFLDLVDDEGVGFAEEARDGAVEGGEGVEGFDYYGDGDLVDRAPDRGVGAGA